MSSRLERRVFLAGLGALVLARPVAAAGRTVPQGTFTLERVLVRSLGDGERLVVIRQWAINFGPSDEAGLCITGKQSRASVDAPPALAALAKLESRRDESGMFPIQLDPAGRIIDKAGVTTLDPLPDTVADAALDYVQSRASAANSGAVTRQFLGDLSTQGEKWLSRMPADLFFPSPRALGTAREIALPGGGTGTIELRETASADPVSGLLETYRREATTITGASTRTGSETWTLTHTVS